MKITVDSWPLHGRAPSLQRPGARSFRGRPRHPRRWLNATAAGESVEQFVVAIPPIDPAFSLPLARPSCFKSAGLQGFRASNNPMDERAFHARGRHLACPGRASLDPAQRAEANWQAGPLLSSIVLGFILFGVGSVLASSVIKKKKATCSYPQAPYSNNPFWLSPKLIG